jgi:hypothetical protein
MLSGDAIWNLGWTFIDLSPLEKLSRICEKVCIGSSDPGPPLTGHSDVMYRHRHGLSPKSMMEPAE